MLETLNKKQELWGVQGLNFWSFTCPSSSPCPVAARQCWRLGARCLRGACGCLQVCCWLQEWLLCYLDGDFFYYFLNICCAFVYGKNYNPRRNCWLMYRWCQMRKSTVWHIQIKQLSVYDTVVWRWFTQPRLPSGCHLPSLHCWALRLGCSLTTWTHCCDWKHTEGNTCMRLPFVASGFISMESRKSGVIFPPPSDVDVRISSLTAWMTRAVVFP